MNAQYFKALERRLGEIATVKQIDWYFGQIEDPDGNQLVRDTPALYIEFRPAEWRTWPGNIQSAMLEFDVHVVTECHYDDHRRFTDDTTGHLALVGDVYKQLMNWRCLLSYVPGLEALAGTESDMVLMESVVRTAQSSDHQLSPFLFTTLSWVSHVFDYSAVPQLQEVLASLELDITYDQGEVQAFTDPQGQPWVDPSGNEWQSV
ncbi:MAG: hypothetical protein D6751_05470 [Deltaproteobacteria bacterium]|nr:MAG: hypothetical protein D6751_05470 [Deltaproteobacteria bacterium]